MKLFLMVCALSAPVTAFAEVTVSSPWARASILASRPGAAYLTLSTDEPDRLIEVTSPKAAHVMVHAAKTGPQGVSSMTHLETLALEPASPIALAPGGMHLMLMDLNGKLQEGSEFPLTLKFETAGEITITVPVLGVGASGPEDE